MTEDDFYADPTIFDLWQDRTGGWFSCHAGRLRPFAWSAAFSAAAAVLLAVAVAVLVYSICQRVGAEPALSWNRSMAQWLTVAIALLASHALLEQALRAWPPACRWGAAYRLLARCGGRSPAPVCQPAAGRGEPDTQALRAFFAEVRAAGVNVRMARALFVAGVRSAERLQSATDQQLLQISGVGPATVRRLRAHFGVEASSSPAAAPQTRAAPYPSEGTRER